MGALGTLDREEFDLQSDQLDDLIEALTTKIAWLLSSDLTQDQRDYVEIFRDRHNINLPDD